MKQKCDVCKSIEHGFYYFAILNDDFANEVRARAKATLPQYGRLVTCEPCIELIRQTLVAQGKSYETCPIEMLEKRIICNGSDIIDAPLTLPKSIYDEETAHPIQQTVQHQADSSSDSYLNTNVSSNPSITSDQPSNPFSIPQQRSLELDFRKRPMPLSVKKQLFVEEKRQQNAKRRKADSSSSSSTNRSNSQISRQFGYSESFITGQQITSTQKHHSEPISGSKFSTLGSLEKSLSIRNLSGSSNNHITSQQSRPSSLNSIEIPLTNQPNTESNSEPVVVQLSDLAGVSTTRGHMRIRRATSEITDSSGFIPIFNDDIVSGNSSSYSQTSSRGREHSNVAAPSRITSIRATTKNLGG